MKIVFVEDDTAFASEMMTALQSAGHAVDYYDTGRGCLKALQENRYDLGLFDWEVPDMSGPEVLLSIKIKGTYPPVVF